MSIIREFTLYLHAGITTPEVIHANQYSQGETWIFKLLQDDGSVYVPSTGALIGVKADGHAIAGLTGTVLGDGRVSITTTQQLTAAAGDATCELTIDGGTNGSANFVIRVEKKPTDDAILSESDLSIIQQGLNSVTPAAINESVSNYLEENLTDPPIDPTLSISNAAADAKVTGDKITELKTALTKSETALDAVYPNLWNCSYSDDEANGITFRKNSDGTYSVTGTATALFYKQQNITLPAGVYGVYGFSGGATSTYHIMISGLGSNAYQTNKWAKITLSAETTITLTMRVTNGTTVNETFKPMVVQYVYRGIDFVPYGMPYYPKTVDEKIEQIAEVTGYEKPNLFNNTLATQTANGLTFTVNEDKSVTIVGTATALSAPNVTFTLPRGKYILNGCNGGSSQQYHLAILKAGSSTFSAVQYGGTDYPFEITQDEQEITLYVRVLSGVTVNDTVYPMVRSESVYNPTYAPYGEYQIYKPIQKLIDYTQFNWSGKKMNVIGDSIVQGSYGNFIIPIRDILSLSEARNYGVGGSCLASSSADAQYPPAVLRYSDMDLDAQIIIVHAGTNDYSAQIPLGADDSTDITTFNGALNVMMNGLREMYPTALIIFDSILHRFNDGALTIKASQYRECIENRCYANHIVFYDAYKYSGFDFVKDYYDHNLTNDGLHPNQTGANILGRKLAGFIRWN